jgi:hypothetical protein
LLRSTIHQPIQQTTGAYCSKTYSVMSDVTYA